MWKVLLVISAVVLGGAAWFAYETMEASKKQTAELASQKDLLASRLRSIDETNAQIAELEASVRMLRDQTETLEVEKIDLDAKEAEGNSALATRERALTEARTKLEGAKALIEDIQRVEAIQREMVQVRAQIEESEIELSQAEGALVRAQVERDRLEKVAAELRALRADQEAGVIRGQFQSTVKAAFNQYGFVVINGGNNQGVVNRAQLDVYRRGQPICKLLVTSVDPAESSAEIIPGSLAPGQTVQPGDTVVAAVRMEQPATPAVGAPGDPAVPGDPTAPAPPVSDDPFGGEAMQEAPPSESSDDPFGGGAMQDAPPSEPSDDPFGGGAMQDAPPSEPAPADAPSDGGAMQDAPADDPFGGGAMQDAPASDAPSDPPAADPFQ